MKFSSVMVVEPIRLRIAPKLGRDRPTRRSMAIVKLRKATRFGPNTSISKNNNTLKKVEKLPAGIFKISSKN